MRYEKECKEIGELALKQLNLEKNKIKERFEDLSYSKIFSLLREEVSELRDELAEYQINKVSNKKRILEELGDCVAVLVGMYAAVQDELE